MAQIELEISEPYFSLLSNSKTQKSLRKSLINLAPKEFHSVVTQLSRHILNNTSELQSSDFREKFQTSLYLLAIPSTNRKEREIVLLKESLAFYKHLHTVVKDILNNGC